MQPIQFLDLKSQYNSIKPEVNDAIQSVLESCKFIMGGEVKEFEREIAAYCGAKHAISCASGTDALLLSLLACGIKEKDTVITTPFTFIATTEAISKIGAKIVFVDIDESTFNIDPEKIREYLEKSGKSVKAILPVHLYGQPADMDPIMDLAKKYNLRVIEDCAQAIGATYRGAGAQERRNARVGSIGDAGCFSFFPSKNLGCYGDGGMLVTNDDEIAKKAGMLRVHGCRKKYYHEIDGYNSRLDTIQAAILRVKLKRLDRWNSGRRRKMLYYNELFQKSLKLETYGLKLPLEAPCTSHVAYAYTIRVKRRDELQAYLKEQGIPSMIYYPVPLHLQDVYKNLGYKKGDFPVSEKLSGEVLSLPIYPELTGEEQECIVNTITNFYLPVNVGTIR